MCVYFSFGPSFDLLSNETLFSPKIVLFANVSFHSKLFILKSVCVSVGSRDTDISDIFAFIHLWNRPAQVLFEVAMMIRVMVILVYEIANMVITHMIHIERSRKMLANYITFLFLKSHSTLRLTQNVYKVVVCSEGRNRKISQYNSSFEPFFKF